ncbi:MAG: diguanylate cyclase [Pseudomonadota bacterium]|nr:diguanylate cyclase [Pseudomonadota bacterium]
MVSKIPRLRQLATRGDGPPTLAESITRAAAIPEPAQARDDGAAGGRTPRAVGSRALLEFSLSGLAQVDLLTELPNRNQFRDRLEGAMARATRTRNPLVVALFDLDRFRQVNHDLGQSDADLLLIEVAGRLRECVRKGDTIARLGGDEFAVLMEGVRDRESAMVACCRQLEAIAVPYVVAGHELRITISIGTSVFPVDANDGDGLMRAADLALCCAKDNGGNRCESYSPALEAGFARAAARKVDTVRCMARLTPRERQVLDILVAGKASKMIAYVLGTSPRTIETHRANIMRKMGADSLPELVRRVVEAGVSSAETAPAEPLRSQNAA